MATDQLGNRHLELAAELVQGDQQSMQPDQDYRVLERSYRQSAEYAAMVQRYPLLHSSINDCASSELVGDPPLSAAAERAA